VKPLAQKQKRALPALFDTGALITTAKFRVRGEFVIGHLVTRCRIKILPHVKREAVDVGLQLRYTDAVELERELTAGHIAVLPAPVPSAPLESVLRKLGLEDTDRAILQSYRSPTGYTRLVTDDHRLFVTAIRLGLSPLFLPGLVVLLVTSERLAKNLGREILTAIQPRYAKGFVELSLRRLEGAI
jgi:hypothetical protein